MLIGILGLGYVGLPLCREFVRGGADVIGFDVDPEKIRCIEAGRTYI
ncbi:MAG: UDP-N-acetyl-D-glucosamine dehydrogenase, partial [Pontiellaceae bacterium]|nr:UDP-N-acetyl-D-glucosamine dehydrogenase [Pontiellaceae bacterium]